MNNTFARRTPLRKPLATTLIPHYACTGGHPRCRCGSYTVCCSWSVDWSEHVAYPSNCKDCYEDVCENCAGWIEFDVDGTTARCETCEHDYRTEKEARNV